MLCGQAVYQGTNLVNAQHGAELDCRNLKDKQSGPLMARKQWVPEPQCLRHFLHFGDFASALFSAPRRPGPFTAGSSKPDTVEVTHRKFCITGRNNDQNNSVCFVGVGARFHRTSNACLGAYQPDNMITQARMGCGAGMVMVNGVCPGPEPVCAGAPGRPDSQGRARG